MTAPDSRDSVERVVAEIERVAHTLPLDRMTPLLKKWADRLQALARGPQQAGGEDHVRAMEARIDAIVSCAQARWPEVTTLESAWDRMCADRNDAEAALAALLAHDFAEDCQECAIGQSEAWKNARALLTHASSALAQQLQAPKLIKERSNGAP